jgi:hypothetical protein
MVCTCGLLAKMRRNLAKPFSIAGFALAEVYMVYTVLAPYRRGPSPPLAMPLPIEPTVIAAGAPIPLDALLLKLALGAVFFGMFGALVGVGIGILISGLLGHFRPPRAGASHDQDDG